MLISCGPVTPPTPHSPPLSTTKKKSEISFHPLLASTRERERKGSAITLSVRPRVVIPDSDRIRLQIIILIKGYRVCLFTPSEYKILTTLRKQSGQTVLLLLYD